ncbi:MAG: DUF4956 domain-containing protein [Atopobiaceae bacterium]|jgi:hypothetical protein|nr:DUF4956 domain-containing protein [Atopobiaceae bacterium]
MPNLFACIFDSTASSGSVAVGSFVACIAAALAIGVFLAFVHSRSGRSSASFVTTLALLPAIVTVIIIMVNGNIGAGVAVAGTFSLVRFRSVPGSAREIGSLFLAMGTGLVCGMGYLGYAVLFALILGGCMVLFDHTGLGLGDDRHRTLRITVPEDLDYAGEFDDLLESYTSSHDLVSVKTTNMGSLYKLTYDIAMRDLAQEKAFIDQLRCRNGNLEIAISRQEANSYEL